MRRAARTTAALLLGLSLALARHTGAEDAAAKEATSPPPLRAYSLAARGPLSLLLGADANGRYWAMDTGWPLGTGGAARPGAASGGIPSGLRLDALMLTSWDRTSSGASSQGLAGTLMLSRGAPARGGWLGVSTGGASEADGAIPNARVASGVWRLAAPFEFEGAAITEARSYRRDPRWTREVRLSVPVSPDSGTVFRDSVIQVPMDHSLLWTTGQGLVRWRHGRMEVETVAGLSFGRDLSPRRWAQGTLRFQVSRQLLFMASTGERPSGSRAFDASAQPRTMVGLQIAPWSTSQWAMSGALRPEPVAWKARRLDSGRILVRVRCRNTHSVELAGDFTDWNPIVLDAVHANWWAAVIRVEPGLHRVQVRVDGGPWLAPPGLPRSDEGPAGPAGVLVVE